MTHTNMTNKLTITAWNMRGMFPVAGPYLNTILNGTDVLALSEHGLYPCELYKLNNVSLEYIWMAKSSRQLSDNNFGSGRGVGVVQYYGISGCRVMYVHYLNSDLIECVRLRQFYPTTLDYMWYQYISLTKVAISLILKKNWQCWKT